MKDFKCPIKLESMEDWIKKGGREGDESCRPCILAPAAIWYLSVLRDAGNEEYAKKLEETFENEDPLTVARELDKIKADVGETLKPKLEEFDCFCQVYKKEDAD